MTVSVATKQWPLKATMLNKSLYPPFKQNSATVQTG